MSLDDSRMPANWFRKGGRLLLERIIDHYGYELKEKARSPSGPRQFLSMLAQSGYRPETVFDVGVGYGTPWLYEAFPEAYFVLVEPNKDLEPTLGEICQRYQGEYHIFAAGPQSSQATMKINDYQVTSSSLLPLESEYLEKLGKRSIHRSEHDQIVDLRPLDDLVSDKLIRPFLLKLDVEGYESEVLRGASAVLQNTDLIVTEISVTKRFEGEKPFGRFVAQLEALDFELFDILNLEQMRPGSPLSYMDAVFLKRGSPLWMI